MTTSRKKRKRLNAKRAALFVFLMVVSSGGAYALHRAQVQKNAKGMLAAANNAQAMGNVTEATDLFTRYLNFRPKDASALAAYAETLEAAAAKQPKVRRQVAEVYERLLTIDPKRDAERRKLVKIYMAAQHYEGVRTHLDYLTATGDGNDPELLEQYAVYYQGINKPGEAMEKLRAAIETKKAGSEAYLRLAQMLRGDLSDASQKEAAALFDRLVVDRPNDVTARVAKARYLVGSNNAAGARAELEAALAQIKDAVRTPELVLFLADLHQRNDDAAAAKALLARGVEALPDDTKVRLSYASTLIRLEYGRAADEQLREALKRIPEADPVAIDVLDLMIDRRDTLIAAAEVRRRFENKPEYLPTFDYLSGKLALLDGQWPAALEKFQRALPAFARQPRYAAQTHLAIGDCYEQANNPDRMAEAYAAALKADPTFTAAKLRLAYAQARLGRTTEAGDAFRNFADNTPAARTAAVRLALYEQAVKAPLQRDWTAFDRIAGSPPYPTEIEVMRAESLAARGKPEEAKIVLRNLADARPTDVPGRVAYARFLARADAKAGLDALDDAEKAIGDRVEIRLARGAVLARMPDVDVQAIIRLGYEAGGSAEERFALYCGLGDLLNTAMNKPAEAAIQYRKAADLKPYNVVIRAVLIDLWLIANRLDLADKVIEELRGIEGPEGPTFLFGQVLRGSRNLTVADRARIDLLRGKLDRVIKARPTWSRPYQIHAQLDDAIGDSDAAFEKFRIAFDLGERDPDSVRRLVQLLVSHRRYDEARRVLATADRAVGGLSVDLRKQETLLDSSAGYGTARANDFVQQMAASNDANDQLFRGQYLMLNGKPAEAIAAFEKLTALTPNAPDGWVGLVWSNAAAGKPDAAKAAAAKADAVLTPLANTFPDRTTVPRTLAAIKELVGDARGAEDMYLAAAKDPTNTTAMAQLAVMYQRSGRLAEAVKMLETILASPTATLFKPWARRELAYSRVSGKDAYAHIHEALALIDQNNPAAAEDLRARGIILSLDPTRRLEARKLIDESLRLSPPTHEDNIRLAETALRENDLPRAEEALRDAIRGTVAAPLRLLAVLHQVQLQRGKDVEARQTLARLTASAPQAWETAAEDARAHAKQGDKAAAAKRLTAFEGSDKPAVQLQLVGPLLAELGCAAEAEAVVRHVVETSQQPGRHAALVGILMSTRRQAAAIDVVNALDPGEYPVGMRARLLGLVFVSRCRAIVPAADLPVWDKAAAAAAAWIAEQMKANPAEPGLPVAAGLLADARGDYAEAIRIYDRIVAADPKQEMAVNNLAYLLALTPAGDGERAVKLATGLITANGAKPHLLDTRAAALIRAGQSTEAIKDEQLALSQVQKPTYWFRLAVANDKAGKVAAAGEALDDAKASGLTRDALHPLEWADYDRLTAPKPKP